MSAPPPPPPPHNPLSKVSPVVTKLKTYPSKLYHVPDPSHDLTIAPTGPYFCYGTLTVPSMLAEILGHDAEPNLRPAKIVGYECKLWGQYPALLDSTTHATVEGMVYRVQTEEDGQKLATYETRSYRAIPCRILYTDGKEPAQEHGHTFQFVGNFHDLTDGEFDLKVWLRRKKGESLG
ncbi:gamma-glutamylcyclotransferase family protein [Aspergillus affinis]|uniref:gamma-glutamylcyclotransferase family protein n=1 Tax=Aspergillus affinis TaxID=1070780 RepID=UPI0022FE34E1|nr:uncharacterized protein KD926_010868 [Aspergillus affinis]KAI9038332.1 hypothetical protein KD926_010868 [Aspergillus affinis]